MIVVHRASDPGTDLDLIGLDASVGSGLRAQDESRSHEAERERVGAKLELVPDHRHILTRRLLDHQAAPDGRA